MALLKTIELENGVETNYHRVVSISTITNINSTIEVASYTSENQRLKEEKYQKLQKRNVKNEELSDEEKEELEKGINVFIETKYYEIEYDKNSNVDSAYEYLKTLDEFKNAKDV